METLEALLLREAPSHWRWALTFPGGDTGQGPLGEPIAQALKGERGRHVRDRCGRGAEKRGGN